MGKKTRSKGPSKRIGKKTTGKKSAMAASSKLITRKMNKLAKKKDKLKKVKSAKNKFDMIRQHQTKNARNKQQQIESDWLEHKKTLFQRETDGEFAAEGDDKEEDDVLPLDMIDPDLGLEGFIAEAQREIELLSGGRRKKRKLDDEQDSGPESHERKRTFGGVSDIEYRMESDKLKHLLPVKTDKGKIVSRFMELAAVENENEDQDQAANEDETTQTGASSKVEDYGSVAEMYSHRAQLLKDYKVKIAAFSNQLIQDPEAKVHKLREMIGLAKGDGVEPLVFLTVQKLATGSLLNIFLNIIPAYKLRERSEQEKEQKLKKETKKLVEFEESLLRNYRRYLQHLESIISKMKKLKSKAKAPSKSDLFLFKMAVTCLTRLLEAHPSFNYSTNIITVIVPLAASRNQEVNELCCQCIRTVMKCDKSGECTLDLVRAMNRFIKDHTATVFPSLLATFTALQIKEVDQLSEREKQQKNKRTTKKKEKLQRLSKKERKYQKQLSVLEREMRETEAQENRNVKQKINTKIMEQVFSTYFRILKSKKDCSSLIEPVLEGLSKFAHFINVDFFDDLISSLLDLMDNGKLKTVESLYCIRTAFVILSGEGNSLNIDPYKFYLALFTLLPRIATEKNIDVQRKQLSLSLQCLDMMIIDRRKKVSLARVAGFAKRLSLISLILHPDLTTGCLSMLRKFLVAHPKLDVLLDEETVGSGKFLPHLDDPEHCNALTSDLKELKLLGGTCSDERVKAFAAHITAGENAKLTKVMTELIEKKAWDFVDEDSESIDGTTTVAVSGLALSKSSMIQRNGNVCLELQNYVDKSTKLL